MSKKTILVVLGFAFLFSYNLARANLVINEIMYYPPAGQLSGDWFEVYNNGSTDVVILSNKEQHTSPWKFSKAGLVTKYYINSPDFTIKAGEYAIFSDNSNNFNSDYITSSNVVDSTINLSNTNKTTLQIFDENGVIVTSAEYDPSKGLASGDGNSLQLINGLWKAATPTPGEENETTSAPPPPSDEEDSSDSSVPVPISSTQGEIKPKIKITEIPKIKTKIIAKTLAFTGIPVEFNASATGYSNEPLMYGKYFWNFGDGDSKETGVNDTAAKFTHTFFYEGEYTVALQYYMNYYSENPNASDEIIINVIPPNISISKIGDEKDFFVEISNNTGYNADLSKWILSGSGKSFTFPKNMILEPEKKIVLSPKITGFSFLDKDSLKLSNPQGEIVFDYSIPTKPVKTLAKNYVPASISASLGEPAKISIVDDANLNELADNLLAEAIKSDASTGNTANNSKYGILGLFAFLGIGTSAAYFIRNHNRKAVLGTTGSDFEIIDE